MIDADGRRAEIPAVVKAYAPATINRELEHVEQAFALALHDGRLLHAPKIPYLSEKENVRKGFAEPVQILDVIGFLPEPYQPVVRFTYLTGWRMHDEVLPLQWRQVDFDAGEIRLDVGTTKNREGRVFAMNEDLRALLLAQKALTDVLQRTKSQTIPWVFHRDGGPIKSFYKAWHTACRKAGVPALIPHDMRRSSARNMIRRGIGQKVAQELMGHKTSAMFDRYRIVSTTELHEGADRLTGILGPAEVRPRVKLAAIFGSGAGSKSLNC